MHSCYTNPFFFMWGKMPSNIKKRPKSNIKKRPKSSGIFFPNNYILKRPRLGRQSSWRRFIFIKDSFHFIVWWIVDCTCHILQAKTVFLTGQFPWEILMSLLICRWSNHAKKKQKRVSVIFGHISCFLK